MYAPLAGRVYPVIIPPVGPEASPTCSPLGAYMTNDGTSWLPSAGNMPTLTTAPAGPNTMNRSTCSALVILPWIVCPMWISAPICAARTTVGVMVGVGLGPSVGGTGEGGGVAVGAGTPESRDSK